MIKINYSWLGIDANGKRCQNVSTKKYQELITELTKANITPLKISRRLSFKQLTTRRIPKKLIQDFMRQLATLINAGIPILKTLTIIQQSSDNKALKLLLTTITVQLKAGTTLSQALRQHNHYFDTLTCTLINIGEHSGTLDIMLTHIADMHDRLLTLKRKITKALFYPISIIVVAIAVTAILLIFVIPQFTALYSGFGASLPQFTQLIIKLSQQLKQHGLTILITTIIAGTALAQSYRRSNRLHFFVDRLLIKTPLIKTILQKAITTRFAHSLAIAYKAGMPLAEALKIVTNTTQNRCYQQAMQQIQQQITQGNSFTSAVTDTKLFTNRMVQLIAIGEESGSLDLMLSKIAAYYQAEINHMVDNLNNLLEPMIMVILGTLIGGLITGMYLPIFKLGTVL